MFYDICDKANRQHTSKCVNHGKATGACLESDKGPEYILFGFFRIVYYVKICMFYDIWQKRLGNTLPSAAATGKPRGHVEKGLRSLAHFRSSVLDRFCESYVCFMTYVLQRFGNIIPSAATTGGPQGHVEKGLRSLATLYLELIERVLHEFCMFYDICTKAAR